MKQQSTHKKSLKKVYRYGRLDLTYAIKRELKFRGKLFAEMGREIAQCVVDDFATTR